MRILLTIPLVILLAFGACKKPVLEVSDNFIPPLVLSTPIHDSLPATAVKALKLDHVTGLKIKHHAGLYSNYFEYEADRHVLLEIVSKLPFARDAAMADTRCHLISDEDFQAIQQLLQPGEFDNTTFFWNEDRSQIDIYECVKPPFRHIIQVTKNTNRILHRIEFLG